jgi:CubicO group peptidase (beta-lactamase class C family)
MKRFILAAAVALSACQTAATSQPPVQALDGALAEAAAQRRAPGIVAAVYRDGRVAELYASGGALCDGSGEANPYAAYEIGSISKHMTAVGLLLLWEQGRVDLEAPVGNYLNDIPDHWKRVTMRQLLTHTSGVPDYEEAGGYAIYETSPRPQQIFDVVRERPLDFDPGTRWHYSNTGYVLISLVIERVSGEHFGDYMREHVFAPHHLEHTFVSGYGPPGVTIAQGCQPGATATDPRLNVRPISEASTYGAGGIVSTLQDWALWDDAFQNGRVLSERSMIEMLTPVTLPDGEVVDYGFGISPDRFRGERRISHNGQTQGFVADYAHFPDRGVSIMIFANSYHGATSYLMSALVFQEMPDLSYDRRTATTDPDPARGELIRRGIRQLILLEAPMDLLGENARAYALSEESAYERSRVADVVANPARIEYIREEERAGIPRHLYRYLDRNDATFYFDAGVVDGKLERLRWDED